MESQDPQTSSETESLLKSDNDIAEECRCCQNACCRRLFPGGYWPEFKKTMRIGVGLMLTQFSQIMLQPVSTMFGGHLGKLELDAISLSNTIINVFGNSLAIGMSTACDTYFAQAFGNKQYSFVGIILQRSLLIHLLLLLICYAFYLNMEAILLLLGQDPDVARLSQQYVIVFMPGLFMLFVYTILRRFLSCQNIVTPFIIIGFIGLGVCALFQYVFLYVFNMGIVGSSLAQNIACLSMVCMTLGYMLITKAYSLTWKGWSVEALVDWGSFTKLGLFGILMLCLEWWAFEITIFLAGILGTTELGAQGVVFNVAAFFFSFGVGLSDASAIRVGQALGAGRPVEAITSTRVGLTLIVFTSTVTVIMYTTLRYQLPLIFTSDRDVINLCAMILPIQAVYAFFDGISFIGKGIFRGAGKQGLATVFVIISYYIIAMPIAVPIMFLTPLGLIGTWIGLTIALFIMGVFYLIYLLFIIDFKKAAAEAYNRVRGGDVTMEVSDTEINEKSPILQSTQEEKDSTEDESITTLSLKDFGVERGKHKLKMLVLKRLCIFSLVLLFLACGILCRLYVPLPSEATHTANCQSASNTTEECVEPTVFLTNTTISV